MRQKQRSQDFSCGAVNQNCASLSINDRARRKRSISDDAVWADAAAADRAIVDVDDRGARRQLLRDAVDVPFDERRRRHSLVRHIDYRPAVEPECDAPGVVLRVAETIAIADLVDRISDPNWLDPAVTAKIAPDVFAVLRPMLAAAPSDRPSATRALREVNALIAQRP